LVILPLPSVILDAVLILKVAELLILMVVFPANLNAEDTDVNKPDPEFVMV